MSTYLLYSYMGTAVWSLDVAIVSNKCVENHLLGCNAQHAQMGNYIAKISKFMIKNEWSSKVCPALRRLSFMFSSQPVKLKMLYLRQLCFWSKKKWWLMLIAYLISDILYINFSFTISTLYICTVCSTLVYLTSATQGAF